MRALLAVFTIMEILLVFAVLVIYLRRIITSLQRTVGYLGKISFGVRAIETQCEPIGPSVTRINQRLAAVAGALDELAGKASGDRSQ